MNPTPAVKRSPKSPRVRRAAPAFLVAALLLVSPVLITPSTAATTVSLFPSTGGSTITRASDTGRWRLVFASRRAPPAPSPRCGTTSLRSLRRGRSRGTCGTPPAALLASVNFTGETASGWQTANLAQPVALAKGTTYTVSYFAPKGGYAATLDYFRGSDGRERSAHRTRAGQRCLPLRLRAQPIRTRPTPASPNYWADVVFTPGNDHDDDAPRRTTTTTRPATTTTTKPPVTTTAPTTTAPTTTPTTAPTTTTSPSACANPTNPWGSLEACGWPGPANTGFNLSQCPGGVLTPNVGAATRVISVTVDDTVINCQDIVGGLDIRAKRVVVKNSRVRYDGGGRNGSGVIKIEHGADATIDHVELNGSNHTHACVWHKGTAMTSHYLNCYGINDGIFSWADTGYSQTTGDRFTIDHSYFHDFTTNAANGHEDGYQTEGASHGTIRHNTYLMTTAANSAIAIWNSIRSCRRHHRRQQPHHRRWFRGVRGGLQPVGEPSPGGRLLDDEHQVHEQQVQSSRRRLCGAMGCVVLPCHVASLLRRPDRRLAPFRQRRPRDRREHRRRQPARQRRPLLIADRHRADRHRGGSRVTETGSTTSAGRAYVSNSYSDTVSVIDTTTNAVIATIGFDDAPRQPTASADNAGTVDLAHGLVNPTVAPDGQHVYVAKSVGGGIAVIDVATNVVTKVIEAGGPKPSGLVFTPDGTRLVVTLLGATVDATGAVTVIDCATGEVAAPRATGCAARADRTLTRRTSRLCRQLAQQVAVGVRRRCVGEIVATIALPGELPFNLLVSA